MATGDGAEEPPPPPLAAGDVGLEPAEVVENAVVAAEEDLRPPESVVPPLILREAFDDALSPGPPRFLQRH